MKRIFIPLLILILVNQDAITQDISKLTVPSSPAFSILDFEPSAVMRPTNARSLATDILSAFDKEGTLLMNLGLEVSPYWLKSHPKLTRDRYLNPNFGQTFIQSLSLSAATVKDSITGDNKLGGGFRFKLYNGKPRAELTAARNELKTQTTVVSIINGVNATVSIGQNDTRAKAIDVITAAMTTKGYDQTIIGNMRSAAQSLANDYTDSIEEIHEFLIKLRDDRIEAYANLAKTVSELTYDRKGLIVELAGATGFNTSQGKDLEKAGVWANLSYSVSPDDQFTLTARYMFTNQDSTLSNFDAGLGFLKKSPKYNITLEAFVRHYRAETKEVGITRVQEDLTYRFAVQGSYTISKDLSVNLSFGKDFDSPFIYGSGYFSILGLSYNLFSREPANLK